MVEYHPISSRDQSRLHQSGKKVLPGIFLGYALFAEKLGKGDIRVADVEELGNLGASEIHARRLNAKEMIAPKSGENFIFPDRRRFSKSVWKRSWKPKIHFNAGPTCKK